MNTNPNAKRIVCYGDSNTWGDNPFGEDRYPANVRWPGVLQDVLGSDHEVIEEGLCGRTFVAEDSNKRHRTGIKHLTSIIQSQEPIDVLVIMLGTNDIKSTYGLSANDIADHLKETIELAQEESEDKAGNTSTILVICPAAVAVPTDRELDERMKGAPKICPQLPSLYEKVAKESGCLFLDAGELVTLETTDGYHLAPEHHEMLGKEVAKIVRSVA